MPTPYAVVFITVPDAKSADKVGGALLKLKLAACVNEVPGLRSRYWWEGKIEEAKEVLLVIKTRMALVPEVARCVKENHPYSLPEVVALPVEEGLKAYLDWLGANTLLSPKAARPPDE